MKVLFFPSKLRFLFLLPTTTFRHWVVWLVSLVSFLLLALFFAFWSLLLSFDLVSDNTFFFLMAILPFFFQGRSGIFSPLFSVVFVQFLLFFLRSAFFICFSPSLVHDQILSVFIFDHPDKCPFRTAFLLGRLFLTPVPRV